MTKPSIRGRALEALVVAFAFLPAVAHADDDLLAMRAERMKLEIEIEHHRRNVPLAIDPADAIATLGRLAGETELEHAFGDVSAPARVNYPDGSPSPVELIRVEVSGNDQLGDVLFFLTMLRYAPGVVQLESLRLTASEGSVTYAARLALPQYAEDRPVRVGASADPMTAARAELEAARRLRDLLVELVDEKQPANASQGIAAFTNAVGPAPVALTEARVDGNLRMSGIALGAAARAAIENALPVAGLTATAVEIPASGLCRPFRVAAALPDTIPEEPALVIGNGLFHDETGRCAARSTAAPVTVTVDGKNPDGIELFLADADIASVFRLLSSLTDESFVLDHDVAGRVRLSVSGATLEETLDALGAAGVVVGPPPLRRVARKGTSIAPRDDDFSGERITVQLQRAALSDVLCLFTNLMALEFGMPPGLERQASIFVNDLEWDRIVDGILASQHLERKIEDTRVLLGSDATKIDPSTLVDACAAASASATTTSSFALVAIEGLGASDLVLAGVARSGADWIAQIEMPGGVLRDLAVGQQLLDGVVASVDRRGITIADARGATRRVELAVPK